MDSDVERTLAGWVVKHEGRFLHLHERARGREHYVMHLQQTPRESVARVVPSREGVDQRCPVRAAPASSNALGRPPEGDAQLEGGRRSRRWLPQDLFPHVSSLRWPGSGKRARWPTAGEAVHSSKSRTASDQPLRQPQLRDNLRRRCRLLLDTVEKWRVRGDCPGPADYHDASRTDCPMARVEGASASIVHPDTSFGHWTHRSA